MNTQNTITTTESATEPKISALCAFLGCEPDELSLERHDHHGLEVYSYGGQEYAVGTDDEADSAALSAIKETAWAFNASFLAGETDLPQEAFDAMRVKCEDANEPILMLIEKTCGVAQFAQSAISADGRGHFLSSYDGEENEQDGFYIYRIN